jgi:hypothetical protein
MKIQKPFVSIARLATCALGLAFAFEADAVPFNDKVEFAADLGSAARIHRMSDPRVATTDAFEYGLGSAVPTTPLEERTGSLWFKWTAPSTGNYHVSGLVPDDLIDVYRNSGGNPGAHIPDNDFSGTLSFSAVAGELLYIRHMGAIAFFFEDDSSPLGFILRKEQPMHETDFGSKSAISGFLAGFGSGNVESYVWTVPDGGDHSIRIELPFPPVDAFEILLKRNGVDVPDFELGIDQNIVLSPGDELEVILEGNVRFCNLNFGPVEPPSTDLGSVTEVVVPSKPMFGFSWYWTAPADGFLRLDLESQFASDSFFFDNNLVFGEEFYTETLGVEVSDTDCETLGYRVGVVMKVTEGMIYEFSENNFFPISAGFVSLKFTSTPTTITERLDAATANMDLGTDAGLDEADAHLAAVLAMDDTHPVGNALRAITRLALLERDPAFAAFIQSLDITNAGTGLFASDFVLTEAPDGLPVFPPGADATERVAALNALFSPRFAEIKGYLDAAQGGDDRRAYLSTTGSFVLDEADILALKASINVLQSIFDLLAVYDLGGSLNAIIQLERDGELDLEHALAEFPGLMAFTASDALADFKTRIRDANTQLCAALVMSAGNRVVCGKHPFPPFGSASGGEDFLDNLMDLDVITQAFDGPVDIGGETIDLSAWNVSSESLRNMLPEIRGNRAIGFTTPDPTLGGIFPGSDAVNSPIEGILGFADPAGFSFWIQSYINNGLPSFFSGPEDDADGDGDSNGKEYFFASDPNDSSVVSQGPVSAITPTQGGKRYRVSFVRRIGAVDVRYLVAVSEDLANWDYSEAEVSIVGSPTPVGDGQGEIITVEIGSDISGSKFVRIHAAAK